VFVENLKETLNLGKKLSHKLKPQSIVLLQGPIGAGKTSFVKGIAKGLSITEDITSPTFALSHHYNSGKIPLIHLDLYRLKNVSSAKEVFFSEEEEAIKKRLSRANYEISVSSQFDFALTNHNVDDTAKKIIKLIKT